MTIGDKLKQARQLSSLTQQQLGDMVGLNADRIQKYENGARKPKEALLKEFCNVLNVPMEFLQNRHIDTYVDVMHSLFELEKTFNLKVIELDNANSKGYAICFDDKQMNLFIEEWKKQKEKSLLSFDTKEKYEEWKLSFPNNTNK